jgi:F-type H+-transporting ATPase subunit gamma
MSDTKVSLQRKINSATELHAVVRTMKAIAAASVGQYENAVLALAAYDRTVQLSLAACFKQFQPAFFETTGRQAHPMAVVAIVFGSDQGLVGQFNDVMVKFVMTELAGLPGEKRIWTVGERLQSRLLEANLRPVTSFQLPKTIHTVTQLVGEVLRLLELQRAEGRIREVFLFHNQPCPGTGYQPVRLRLLPLDTSWRQQLSGIHWPSNNIPEVLNASKNTLFALVNEYLFVSLYRTCAESLASENASRLLTMQRAEKNIEELLSNMQNHFHRLRQSAIDEELFDVVSGFEALQEN